MRQRWDQPVTFVHRGSLTVPVLQDAHCHAGRKQFPIVPRAPWLVRTLPEKRFYLERCSSYRAKAGFIIPYIWR